MIVAMGSHIVEVSRIARVVQRHGEQFLSRIYTSDEIRACHARNDSMQNFAAYWSAKEAVLDVLATSPGRGLIWTDIEIIRDSRQRAQIRLQGSARDLAAHHEIDDILITLAHCRFYATATAIGVRFG